MTDFSVAFGPAEPKEYGTVTQDLTIGFVGAYFDATLAGAEAAFVQQGTRAGLSALGNVSFATEPGLSHLESAWAMHRKASTVLRKEACRRLELGN